MAIFTGMRTEASQSIIELAIFALMTHPPPTHAFSKLFTHLYLKSTPAVMSSKAAVRQIRSIRRSRDACCREQS